MPNLRVVFIGQNGHYTIHPLTAVARKHTLVGIVENVPRDQTPPVDGQPYSSPLQRLAAKYRVPHRLLTYRGSHITEFLDQLKPDIACVASMTQLLSPTAIAIPKLGIINVHPSLLPLYRGPSPYFWQYHQMDLTAGVSIHFVDAQEDTGDILVQKSFPIPLGIPWETLLTKSIKFGSNLMLDALDQLARGTAQPKQQRHLPCPLRARYVDVNEKLIDWAAWPIERIWHFMRGTSHSFNAVAPPGSGSRWRVGQMIHSSVPVSSDSIGLVQRDNKGYFVAHRQGTIRLKAGRPFLQRVLNRLRFNTTPRIG